MVEITFAVGGWEYFEGLLVSSLKRLFPRVGFLAFPVIMLIGLLGVLRVSDDPLILAAFALAISAGLFLLLSVVPAVRAAQYAADPGKSATVTWRFGPQRIEIRSGGGRAVKSWKDFERPVETWRLFLLHSAAEQRSIYILPKRAFRGKEQIARYREIVRTAYPERKLRRP